MKAAATFSSLVLFLCLAAGAGGQNVSGTGQVDRAQPFFFDAMNFAAPAASGLQGRLDVYVHVPYNIVQFVKKDNSYTGGFSITAVLTDIKGDLIKEITWDRKIELLDFERTINPNVYDLSSRPLAVEPGEAMLEVVFEDKESARKYRGTKRIVIKRYSADSLGISDIMLVAKVEETGGKRQIIPQIDPNMSIDNQGFYIYHDVYSPVDSRQVRMQYRIKRQSKVVSEQSKLYSLKRGQNPFVTNIGNQQFHVGGYTIEAVVANPDDTTAGTALARTEKPFVLEWVTTGGATVKIQNLDDAVAQLTYFAKSDEIREINDAPDETEKRKRFEDFWERHNPTPGSPVNTAMIEYYNRVAYANDHFNHFQAGWKSDRGMVFILYGPPTNIESHPMESETRPYEVWEYYDIAKRFYFVDNTGFGDYRLLYPLWDDRNRMR